MLTCMALSCAALLLALWSTAVVTGALFYSPGDVVYSLNLDRSARQQVDAQQLSSRNFFGVYDERKVVIVAEELPETELKLTLKGSIASNIEAEASAFIEDDYGSYNEFRIGDKVPGNAELVAVNNDSVVLSRNGIMETLYFPSEEDVMGDGQWHQAGGSASKTKAKQRRAAVRKRIEQLRAGQK